MPFPGRMEREAVEFARNLLHGNDYCQYAYNGDSHCTKQ